jgi:hypothetical protein
LQVKVPVPGSQAAPNINNIENYRKDIPVIAPEFQIANKSGVTRTKRNGTVVRELAVATFDPSANSSQRTVAAHGLGVYLPTKAIITNVIVDVVTTFTSATDAGTIAIHAQSANDIIAAIAISDSTNVWDAGIHGSKIGYPILAGGTATDTAVEVAALFAGSMLKLTAAREITATVAVEALTAGKVNIYVEYVLSD